MRNLKGKRAILYRRVSTTEQKKSGNSLHSQQNQLIKFCQNNQIHNLKEFEEDYSAKNFNRPEWSKLNKYAKANYKDIDLLLVVNWDRFSRNTLEALNTIDTFSKINIEVNSINNWIDYQDPTQKFIQLMYLGMPEVDNKMKGIRIKKAMREVRKSGRWCSKQPFGYLPGKDHLGKSLMKVDPNKGELLKSLFELYSSGNYTQSEILQMTMFKPLKLSKSNLSRILQNIVYAGFMDVPAYEDEPKQTVKALHEPVTDIITFNKVQELFRIKSSNKQKPKSFNKKLFLRGFLKCSKCGGNLTGSASTSKTGKKHYYYHCNSSNKCGERHRAELVNNKFDQFLKKFQIKPEIKKLFIEILRNKFSELETERFNQIKMIENDIQKIKTNQDILLDKLISGTVNDIIYDKKNTEYVNKINELNVELSNLEDYENDLRDYIEFSVELMTNMNKIIGFSDEVTLQKFMSSIFNDKLEFEKEDYRTPKLNPSVNLIFLLISDLELNKNKKGDTFSDVSHEVLEVGIEPTPL